MRLIGAMAALLLLAGAAVEAAGQQPSLSPVTPKIGTESPVAAPTSATRALTRADLEPWLGGFMTYALKRVGVAGAVVVIVKDGEVVLQKGYGWADVDKRVSVDAGPPKSGALSS